MPVVPYIGTWIETANLTFLSCQLAVVPYIGTWIETLLGMPIGKKRLSYLI